eukprot:scaffold332153_cov16-Prasinocladus_malaysianus.AAC.1
MHGLYANGIIHQVPGCKHRVDADDMLERARPEAGVSTFLATQKGLNDALELAVLSDDIEK